MGWVALENVKINTFKKKISIASKSLFLKIRSHFESFHRVFDFKNH